MKQAMERALLAILAISRELQQDPQDRADGIAVFAHTQAIANVFADVCARHDQDYDAVRDCFEELMR